MAKHLTKRFTLCINCVSRASDHGYQCMHARFKHMRWREYVFGHEHYPACKDVNTVGECPGYKEETAADVDPTA